MKHNTKLENLLAAVTSSKVIVTERGKMEINGSIIFGVLDCCFHVMKPTPQDWVNILMHE
jgi:hypothetical protein